MESYYYLSWGNNCSTSIWCSAITFPLWASKIINLREVEGKKRRMYSQCHLLLEVPWSIDPTSFFSVIVVLRPSQVWNENLLWTLFLSLTYNDMSGWQGRSESWSPDNCLQGCSQWIKWSAWHGPPEGRLCLVSSVVWIVFIYEECNSRELSSYHVFQHGTDWW